MSGGKKVSFGPRRSQSGGQANPDDWVAHRASEEAAPVPSAPVGPVKRLTVDLPAELHGRVKAACALKGVKMVEEVTKLLEAHFPPSEGQG